MGNAGDRKGQGGPSGVKKPEEKCEHYMEFGQGGTLLNYHVPGLVVYSPSHNPRAYQSPSNPEVLVSSIHTLPQSIMDNKDKFYGRWISAEITWNCAGNSVAVLGSWDNWQTIEPLQRTGENFTVTKVLPVGIHYYRFIVDGVLVCASDLQLICDDYGNRYNILNLQEEVLKAPSNGPAHLSEFECPPSPPSSYDNRFFTDEDFYYRTKEGKFRELQPPQLPPQLVEAFLDKPSSSADIHHSLSRPEFSQLNHLYTQQTDGDQYVAITSTQRFGNKYVTAILFKPLPETK
ncbi:SNF1-related protein kinase regulatory subunit beta-2-like [Corylus avellana]|uniref:SNF1-related protein kinase regulatory subunit beta-2-like n=1 Tax=Corylus avellana TaxID=13451 RepID=UPI00286A31DC|nr:SNF1-related protein kinase regulatory subunit beta-2-like [Corylus avellana]